LVRLLTELGLDTGYTRDNWRRDYFEHCNAGLEHNLSDPRAPYVVKDPSLCETLRGILASGNIAIDHALIPIRDLDDVTASRIRVGGRNGSVPGGLLKTDDPSQQKPVMAEMFHHLALTLVTYEIPHTFLLFPRIVQDWEYAYARLLPVLGGIDKTRFEATFNQVADRSLVHSFVPGQSIPACDTKAFEAARWQKRRKRFARRFLGWSTVAAVVAFNIGSYWHATDAIKPTASSLIKTTTLPSPVASPTSFWPPTFGNSLGGSRQCWPASGDFSIVGLPPLRNCSLITSPIRARLPVFKSPVRPLERSAALMLSDGP
jgi:hypothetical protein